MSALANPQSSNSQFEVAALEEIVDLARSRVIGLQLTTAYERDFERWFDRGGREQRLAWLAAVPPLRRIPGVFRLDVSALDGEDVIGDDEDVLLDDELRRVLLPSLASGVPPVELAPASIAKLFSDIDHLAAHERSGAAAFVTLDASTILRRHAQLKCLGIVVVSPTQALRSL